MRSFMRALAVLSLAAVAALALVWLVQRRLIYFPAQDLSDPTGVLPGVEEVTLPTADDLSLAAWFVPAATEQARGTVLVFNGNAGNRADRTPLAASFAGQGFAVLLVDYRGYGGNPGSPSEEGLAADARAALAYVRARPGLDTDRLVYFGESLGAGVAVGLAADSEPAALVLRSPFTSLPDVASTHYPFLPTSLLLRDRYPNLERIRGIDSPVMVIAGSEDGTVPVEQSRAVYEAVPGRKELLVLDGADHNDFALTAGPRLVDEVVAFLDEVLPPIDG